MGTFHARADLVRNRLYVTMKGFSDDAEMEQNVRTVIAETQKLRPGFVMISDISEMKATTPAGAHAMERSMEAYKRQGIARIIRIVGQELVGKMQLGRLTKNAAIPVDYVTSLAEAEELLRSREKA
jgi:hypothetical protein